MAEDQIEIVDAHENNLKHVNINIPKGKLVMFVGVSGSGKSSFPVVRRKNLISCK